MKTLIHRLLLTSMLLAACAWGEPASNLPTSLLKYEPPPYPAALKGTSVIDGYATLAFIVNADGQVSESLVLEATHPAFGDAVLEVLPTWRFEAKSDPLPRREVIRFEFASKGVVTTLSHRDAFKAGFPPTAQQRMPIRTVQWKDLKSPLDRLAAPSPKPATSVGKVAVSYVIDTEGHVRVPYIVNTTHPDLGLATLAAVKQWQFSPPTHDGAPVLVEDLRSFSFGAPAIAK